MSKAQQQRARPTSRPRWLTVPLFLVGTFAAFFVIGVAQGDSRRSAAGIAVAMLPVTWIFALGQEGARRSWALPLTFVVGFTVSGVFILLGTAVRYGTVSHRDLLYAILFGAASGAISAWIARSLHPDRPRETTESRS